MEQPPKVGEPSDYELVRAKRVTAIAEKLAPFLAAEWGRLTPENFAIHCHDYAEALVTEGERRRAIAWSTLQRQGGGS